jgi:hypothetical protein
MHFVTTRRACQLTGLSKGKLREWTSRRDLVPADIPPKSKGSPAKYSWQAILLLRIAVTLRERFHLELQAHRQTFISLRHSLQGTSFLSLWGKSLVIHTPQNWTFVEQSEHERWTDDAILIWLAPHLEALSHGFALPRPSSSPGQLDLFPVQAVMDREQFPTAAMEGGDADTAALAYRRRRSA